MKRTAAVLAVTLVACADPGAKSGPPITQFYFPASLEHVDVPGKTEGVLFVSNTNNDKRYATGSLVAVALDELGLPALGASTGAVPQITDLRLTATQAAQINTFAGEMALQTTGTNSWRLFVPTRSESMRAYRVKAGIGDDGRPFLACSTTDGQNCSDEGASLSPPAFENSDAGIPRAPLPYGVAFSERSCSVDADCCPADDASCGRTCSASVCQGTDKLPFADVWITHLSQADSPAQSTLNYRGYLVRLDSDAFSVAESNFINIGAGGSNSILFHKGWAYLSGRFLSPAPNLLRMVRSDGTTLSTALEYQYRVADARGMALSSDGSKLYMIGRVPDVLLSMSITNAEVSPTATFLRATPLPNGPNEVRVIHRAGKGDLVLVSCTSSGTLAIYDEDVGNVATLVTGVGLQPFGIAVDQRGDAARVYVSDFGDGRVAVIDIPDLSRPQTARLVAHLGAQQLCIVRGVDSPGCKAVTQ